MQVEGFEIQVSEVDGYILFETIWPTHVDMSRFSIAASMFFALWEESRPNIALSHVGALDEFSPELTPVVQAMLRRLVLYEHVRCSAWNTDGNTAIAAQLRELLAILPGAERSIFETRDAALAYLLATCSRRDASDESEDRVEPSAGA